MASESRGWAASQIWSWRHASPSTHDPSCTISAGLLGERDEVLRQEPAELRVLPADQRLHAVDPAALQIDDRLVEERQLLPLDRGPERGLEVEPLADVGIHPRLVRLRATLAVPLGGVHRHVRVPKQVVRPVTG